MTQYKCENIKLPDSRLNTLKLATTKKKNWSNFNVVIKYD